MRINVRFLVPFVLLLPMLAISPAPKAEAQSRGTTKRELPNVLLLVDTSGSMERMAMAPLPGRNDSPLPGEYEAFVPAQPALPLTTACVPGAASKPNRWGSLVQSLTGTFQPYYSCGAMSRASSNSTFTGLYGTDAVDLDYFLPYNRPISGGSSAPCGLLPEKVATTYKRVEAAPIDLTTLGRSSALPCSFSQASDGQLDIASDLVRLGLMTFDSVTDAARTKSGAYSYYLGTAPTANPAGCTDAPKTFEVGGRSDFTDPTTRTDAVPEWEGTMVRFPDPNATTSTNKSQTDRIQNILASLRPSGATPTDALLSDARDYLWNDSYGPRGTQPGFGDDFVKGGCRDQYVILLTDGAPNLDMRPSCEGGGVCPYPDKAKQVANAMFNASDPTKKITTFVIGFSINATGPGTFPGGATSCRNWYDTSTAGGATPAARATAFAATCAAAPEAQVYGSPAAGCCSINEISVNGNGGPAAFAENQADLSSAFADILSRIASDAGTRSTPTYAPASGANSGTATFSASFQPTPTVPWSGDISRERFTCVAGARQAVAQDMTKGDDFNLALRAQITSLTRNFLLVNPPSTQSGLGEVANTEGLQPLRPYQDTSPPDFPAELGSEVMSTDPILDIGTAGVLANAGRSLAVTSATCAKSLDASNNVIPALTGDDCKKSVLGFTVAANGANMNLSGYDFRKQRCPNGIATCNVLGAIYRANPTFVGTPGASLRDETYRAFATAYSKRPAVLYVATGDGQLHAMDALHDQTAISAEGRELWSFIPPAVMPSLKTNLPRGSRQLIDGTPIVKDVVFDRKKAAIASTQIAAGAIDQRKDGWHSVLTAAIGGGTRGFYALDITDPSLKDENGIARPFVASLGTATSRNPGPHFLWQMTYFPKAIGESTDLSVYTDIYNQERVSQFGQNVASPAIATLFFDPAGGTDPHEIAVAILPGGYERVADIGMSCTRRNAGSNMAAGYPARAAVRKWTKTGDVCNHGVVGRSVTIVRLDNGQVIRAFGRNDSTYGYDLPQALITKGLVIDAPFDSPMVGMPVVFPGGAGTIGQKSFVTDADGTVWRIDLTSTNPSSWNARMFFDTQNTTVNTAPVTTSALQGEPIGVPPVLSSNKAGEVVMAVATGDQEQFPRVGPTNYVYSLVENYGSSISTSVNWFHRLATSERVTGPMAIFDSILYYATYVPSSLASVCGSGNAYVYGVDYIVGASPSPSSGGVPRTFLMANAADYAPQPVAADGKLGAGTDPVPGVSIRSLSACSSDTFEAYANGTNGANPTFQSGEFKLVFGKAGKDANGVAKTSLVTIKLPAVQKPTRVDSWAAVLE